MSYWRGRFNHGYQQTYTTGAAAIGPTTLTGARGTLPQPTPTDLNAVWLAPNGNNANAGTQAAPKLTLQDSGGTGAVNTLGGAKTTIQIFRNGYVGEMVFTVTAGSISLTTNNLQVEEGETAIIRNLDVSTDRNITVSTGKINGLYADGLQFISTNVGTIDNCYGYSGTVSGTVGGCYLAPSAAITATANRCAGYLQYQPSVTGTTANFNNCIALRTVGAAITNYVASVVSAALASLTLNFNRCIFWNTLSGQTTHVLNIATTGNIGLAVTFTSCFINGASYLIEKTGTSITTLTLTQNYCVNKTTAESITSGGTLTVSSSTITNALSPATPPLFIDSAAFLADQIASLYGLSLQAVGKATFNGEGKFFINSPLIDAGLAGVDIGPFTEATSAFPPEYTEETDIEWPAAGYTQTNRMINPINIDDVRGNRHTGYDAIHRVYEFTFGGGGKYASNEDMRKLIFLLMDNGSMEFYERGYDPGDPDQSNLFRDPNTDAVDSTTGIFTEISLISGSSGEVEVVFDSGLDDPYLIPGNWRGFWIFIQEANGGDGGDFWIERNDADTFYIINKRDYSWPPPGVITFSINFILVTPEKADLQAVQEYFTNFRKGGGQREQGDFTTTAFELSGYTIRFHEVEDDEEGS